jgi:hypothetical protein
MSPLLLVASVPLNCLRTYQSGCELLGRLDRFNQSEQDNSEASMNTMLNGATFSNNATVNAQDMTFV